MKKILLSLIVICAMPFISAAQEKPLRLGVAGLSHGHLGGVAGRAGRGDFVVVGVAEANDTLRANNNLRGKVADDLFYADLAEMLDKTRPEAVIVYEPIAHHLRVVEVCAPRGIHVMVEKPLATTEADAKRMAELARKHKIHLLTNYETTWYASLHETCRMVNESAIGNITRINVYDGHQGPFEIGCGKRFTDWLTDPVLNGGGAVVDFGCYGANIATWLMQGQKPQSVYAVLNHQKPAIYPKVDDDATIVVQYPNVTVQIMASWNWPMSRKDMHLYGSKGYIYQDNATDMRVCVEKNNETPVKAPALKAPYNDPFLYLKAVVRNQVKVEPTDLSSLENNLVVMSILDAAIRSGKSGEVVKF